MKLPNWVRRLVDRPAYDPTRDPVVRSLRTIRRESLLATKASQSAVREANRVEAAYLHDRLNGKGRHEPLD